MADKTSILASFMVPHPPLIVPGIGRGGEKQVQKTIDSYESVASEISSLEPETIIIISPHATIYSDYFHISPGSSAHGSFERFRAPDVSFSEAYDEELVDLISKIADRESFPAGTKGLEDTELDHGTMVPLWFVRGKYKGGKIVRISFSGLPLKDHYKFGNIIAEAVAKLGRKVVVIASGDLSHKLQDYGPYGYVPEGPKYDERIMDVMGRAAFDELLDFDESFCNKAAECGHRSFVIMAGIWGKTPVTPHVFSHEDVTGVGYGICSFYPSDTLEKGDDYVRLARMSLESYIRNGKKIAIPDGLPEEMLINRAGAFVSIHKNGDLRGCIGTICPTTANVASEIINNAISASTRDPRFLPITEEEFPSLEINVDVLGEAEDIDSMDKLDVKRYGVIVSTSDGRRGLLLPDLEGVDTVEYQVAIAMRKGGIMPGENYHLQRFEVIRHR